MGTITSALQGRTYVLPLEGGQLFPRIPDGGFKSEAEIAAIPGATVIDSYDVALGPSAGTYAYSRQSVQRNVYRIPIP
jgi:hypothetical protein